MGHDSARTALKTKEASVLIVKRDTNNAESLDSKYRFRDGMYQSFVSLTILSLQVNFGLYYNFPAILYSQTNITFRETGWVASMFSIGALVGGFLLGPISDKIGRKATCILATIFIAGTWAAAYCLPEDLDLRLIYAIRFISGLVNSLLNSGSVYVSEATNRHWRPMLLVSVMVFVSFGICIAAIVGSVLSWRSYSLLCLLVAILHSLILFLLPESPHWLIRSDPRRAEGVLKKLNKNKKNFLEEWEALEARRLVREDSNFKEARLLSREVRQPMLRLILLKTLQHFCGVYIISVFALQMSHGVTHSTPSPRANGTVAPTSTLVNGTLSPTLLLVNVTVNPNLTEKDQSIGNLVSASLTPHVSQTTFKPTPSPNPFKVNATLNRDLSNNNQVRVDNMDTICFIGIGTIRFVISCLNVFLAKHVNNRFMLMLSAFGGATFAFVIAAVTSGVLGPTTAVVPLVLTISFFATLCCGVSNLPWTLISELVPLSYRAKGTGIMSSVTNLLDFITFSGFPYALELFGMSLLFVFFGGLLIVLCVYVYFFIPETRGKTFVEIEEYFK